MEYYELTHPDLRPIHEYLGRVGKVIRDFSIDSASLQVELAKLDKIITEVTVVGVQTEDSFNRTRLAFLESKARHCRECILIRLEKQK